MEKVECVMDEKEINRRLAYVHEGGHAVVALEYELSIIAVTSDGQAGHCHAELPDSANRTLAQLLTDATAGKISAMDYAKDYIAVYAPKLATAAGGIAAEGLLTGRAIYTVRRSADDAWRKLRRWQLERKSGTTSLENHIRRLQSRICRLRGRAL